jgi:IclR family transcriptional regulator, acetate operon repressor
MDNLQLVDKTLDILEALAALERASMPQIQERCGLPMTTTHRIIQSLLRRGFLLRSSRGDYRLGSAVLALGARVSEREIIAAVARPLLQRLAKSTRSHAHLGIWEDGMVTYVVKQPFGRSRIHSAEGMQLEAYCSAIGKVLLAGLRDGDLDCYLSEGEFVTLTTKTLVDPGIIRAEIDIVRARGWSTDDEEISPGLRCVSVPVLDQEGRFVAAISVSSVSTGAAETDVTSFLPLLNEAAQAIGARLFPHGAA